MCIQTKSQVILVQEWWCSLSAGTAASTCCQACRTHPSLSGTTLTCSSSTPGWPGALSSSKTPGARHSQCFLSFLLQLGTHCLLVYMVQNRRSLRHKFEISRRFLVTGLHYGMGGTGRDENLLRHLVALVLSIKRFVKIHCLDLLQGIFVPNLIRIV